MKELTFITSVLSKYQEIRSLLSEWNQYLQLKTFEEIGLSSPQSLIPHYEHLGEYQAHLNSIASDKVKEAFQKIQNRCFLEVTGLYLENPYQCPHANSSITVKNFYIAHEFANLLSKSSEEEIENTFATTFNGCKGQAIISLAYTSDGENVQIFEGELEGTVVMPKGKLGNAWEYPSIKPIFCFFS